ncbi:MAG: metalloregulator ArsR/SmtB family transcription factor [Alphaproteobacteria bacterium]|nr:metalloregulator ArsR/SmtB family transcription factor [Alphaproteobacteria bacterium]
MTAFKAQAMGERAMAQENFQRIAAFAKALGHPARLEIVAMLHERQTCIGCDIVDRIGLAQSTTSEHLRILKAAGIITGEIDPPRVCYSLNAEVLEPLCEFLREIADASASRRRDQVA